VHHDLVEAVKSAPFPQLEPGEVLYEFLSPFDDLGRAHFVLYWFTDYRPGHPEREYDPEGRLVKGQHFFADPRPYQRRNKEAGIRVREVRSW
jgi:hypothetical protein